MDLQKHRSSTRKSKQIQKVEGKESSGLPLLEEISNLKNELRSIKSKKSLRIIQDPDIKDYGYDSSLLSASPKSVTKLEKTQKIIKQKFSCLINPFILEDKQEEKTLNMQLQMLFYQIQELNIEASLNTLNGLVGILNHWLSENKKSTVSNFQQFSEKGLKEQAEIYQKMNRQLEKQNIEMRILIGKLEHRCQMYRNSQAMNQERLQKMNRILINKDQEFVKERELRERAKEERQKLVEQMRIYERWIQKKQSKITQMEQQLRIVVIEKQKQLNKRRQKQKQIQRIEKQKKIQLSENKRVQQQLEGQMKELRAELQDLRFKNKQMHRAKQCQLLLEKQKQKQRQGLKQKEIQKQKLKEEIKCLSEQIRDQNKICQQRDELIIEYQAQNYELKKQNQRLAKHVQMARKEISTLTVDLKELQQQSNKYKQIVIDSQFNEKNIAKISALKEIKQLIQFYKTSQQQGIFAT